ncbi:SOS response-associated peptidase family protein [Alteromonas flava]|uniref:SOS response-associated peptidase family protein n=1 Tax=Alteromonas flava TaxID=2048003 RepID=UPI000C29135D|nr:SOS response-associated peptidase family protein [Alteromonas flava]
MCGRLNVTDDEAVRGLCEQLGLPFAPNPSPERFVRAAQNVWILLQDQIQPRWCSATWWLLLDKVRNEDGSSSFKPSRYTSFNTRSDKLNVKGSAGYHSFRQQRCLVMVTGFGESQKTAEGVQYTDFRAEAGHCIVLGGLYRKWPQGQVSFSIITTPAHPKIAHYHQKASPLMLPQSVETLLPWLDPTFSDVEYFAALLEQPLLPQSLIAQAIDKPSSYETIAEPVFVPKDQ